LKLFLERFWELGLAGVEGLPPVNDFGGLHWQLGLSGPVAAKQQFPNWQPQARIKK
jgi:hypothetical protein